MPWKYQFDKIENTKMNRINQKRLRVIKSEKYLYKLQITDWTIKAKFLRYVKYNALGGQIVAFFLRKVRAWKT